jgi:gamma-glutamylcyclotransferase (GGCT)/AIG2-like uncharacterized protein YtfP
MTTSSNQSHFVFVYGTLMGMRDGTLIGKAKTLVPTLMYGGGFPVVVSPSSIQDVVTMYGAKSNYKGYVVGELHVVDDTAMKRLDAYEGAPNFYDREQIEVEVFEYASEGFPSNTDTHTVMAWIYTGRDVLKTIPRRQQIVPSPEGTVSWSRN